MNNEIADVAAWKIMQVVVRVFTTALSTRKQAIIIL
jgi:hypothetical protein